MGVSLCYDKQLMPRTVVIRIKFCFNKLENSQSLRLLNANLVASNCFFLLFLQYILLTENKKSGINSWINIGIMFDG